MTGSFVHSPSLRRLLLLDGLINLGLGALLVVFPDALVQALGVPPADTRFYPSVLGGVLLGVGIALLLEHSRRPAGTVGLGLGGAVAINLCAAAVLAVWLVWGNLPLPARGSAFLWGLVVLLVGLSALELYQHGLSDRSA